MPKIVIKDRQDRDGPVNLTVGAVHRKMERNAPLFVSDSELEALLASHEGDHVIVYPESNDADAHSAKRPEPDTGGNEAGTGKNGELRRTSPRP